MVLEKVGAMEKATVLVLALPSDSARGYWWGAVKEVGSARGSVVVRALPLALAMASTSAKATGDGWVRLSATQSVTTWVTV